MPSLWEIVLAGVALIALGLAGRLRRMPPPSCHCDEAEQGRECRNCTPPHIPRPEP